MPLPTLANFVVYVLQVAAIAAAGVAVAGVFGLAAPRARLLHFRIVLVVAVTLPLVWSAVARPAAPTPAWLRAFGPVARPPLSASEPVTGVAAGEARVPPVPALPYLAGPMVLAAFGVGLAARAAWVAAGFRRLRRLRLGASRLEPRPAPVREAVALAAADADIRLSPDVACPVSFGDRRATVLLPAAINEYPDDEQRAVTCHELIHVRRHDWMRAVGDETVRAVFWFHPAIWWLLDAIELAREQVVDQEVVALIGRRRPYLEALVKLARPVSRPALRPVASFLAREHLAQRVALLLKETGMSKMRLIGGLAASTSSVLAVAAVVVWALPLQAAGRAEGAPLEFLHLSRSGINSVDRPTLLWHPGCTTHPGAVYARRPAQGFDSRHGGSLVGCPIAGGAPAAARGSRGGRSAPTQRSVPSRHGP
jgi:beta-lactamase regulating signal transducer with metallopeptidase domain